MPHFSYARDCREYPTQASAYELLEECGRGVSATVSGLWGRVSMVQRLHRAPTDHSEGVAILLSDLPTRLEPFL